MGRKTYMFNERVSLLLLPITQTTVGVKVNMIEVTQVLGLFGDRRKNMRRNSGEKNKKNMRRRFRVNIRNRMEDLKYIHQISFKSSSEMTL